MHKYQSLEAWKLAHRSVILIHRVTDATYHPKSRNVFDQMRRAAVSVEANIVEGYALGTAPLYLRHLRIAFGSAAEAECLARTANELAYIAADDAKRIEASLASLLKVLFGLLKTARRAARPSPFSPLPRKPSPSNTAQAGV